MLLLSCLDTKRLFFHGGVVVIARQGIKHRQIWKFLIYPVLLLLSGLFIYASVADLMVQPDGAPVALFGVRIAPVRTDDLAPQVSAGDAVIVSSTAPEQIQAGDLVVYRPVGAQVGVGRAVSSSTILDVLYVTVQSGSQAVSVPADHIYGTASRFIPYAGYVLDFLDTPAGTVICIGGPLLILILIEIISVVRRAKKGILQDQAAPQEETFPPEEADALDPLAPFRIGARDPGEPVYQAGSFSPQYAYRPPQPPQEDLFSGVGEEPPQEQGNWIPRHFPEPEQEILPPGEEELPPLPEGAGAEEGARIAAAAPDQKLSLTLSGDESSEFTVNGINIRYEDDTLDLSLDPNDASMHIRVRMRDDEAQLLFRTPEKTTRFSIVNQEGKPRRISISGKEDPADSPNP